MTARDRRALVAGCAVIATAWLLVRGLPDAARMIAQAEDETVQRAALLARMRDRVHRLPSIDDSLRVLDEVAVALPHMLLVGGDRETAAVDLMRRIRDSLAHPEAKIIGFEPLDVTETSGPLTLASIRVDLETDFRGLLELLGAIEADPALEIESLDATAAAPHGRDDRPEILTADIGISGWYRPDQDAEPQEGILR